MASHPLLSFLKVCLVSSFSKFRSDHNILEFSPSGVPRACGSRLKFHEQGPSRLWSEQILSLCLCLCCFLGLNIFSLVYYQVSAWPSLPSLSLTGRHRCASLSVLVILSFFLHLECHLPRSFYIESVVYTATFSSLDQV